MVPAGISSACFESQKWATPNQSAANTANKYILRPLSVHSLFLVRTVKLQYRWITVLPVNVLPMYTDQQCTSELNTCLYVCLWRYCPGKLWSVKTNTKNKRKPMYQHISMLTRTTGTSKLYIYQCTPELLVPVSYTPEKAWYEKLTALWHKVSHTVVVLEAAESLSGQPTNLCCASTISINASKRLTYKNHHSDNAESYVKNQTSDCRKEIWTNVQAVSE